MDREYLAQRAQRFGLLPTWWFWNRRENWRLITIPVVVAVTVGLLVTDLLGLGLILSGLVPALFVVATVGFTERWVRRRLAERQLSARLPGREDDS